MMCKALGVVRASFYRWLKRKEAGPTQRDARHQELVAVIKAKVKATKGMAGRQALTVLLNDDGVKVSESTVGAIMRAHGLQAKRLRAFTTTTVQDPQANTAHIVNHMLDADGNRDFSSQAPGTRLCGDITYLRTGEGWLYLATVLDLCTGMVIGWSMADHMRSSLVIDAMEMARDHGYMCSDQVVYHTDRGAQYTSARFQAWCVGNGVTQSMGKVGVCWDNAVAENFFSHLKTEFYHHESFSTRLEARTAVMEYIEVWYNRKRPNARAGFCAPAVAWAQYQEGDRTYLAA
ncbi:IS3 family transposase [Brevibacterium sp. SMBL_HHYL_HB1]|jgi:putative transposase|uniref:IS3 family transposase n=1 Tax=Brevibacterium sp. SMBL_HHYL_HB1 TaxID=2777556 RepID=UPI0020131964|nr:IS3 family transposase [Brevibacterium sp. SMBL_HHYL_HB1]